MGNRELGIGQLLQREWEREREGDLNHLPFPFPFPPLLLPYSLFPILCSLSLPQLNVPVRRRQPDARPAFPERRAQSPRIDAAADGDGEVRQEAPVRRA